MFQELIKAELNDYKLNEMMVHEDSKRYTRYVSDYLSIYVILLLV